MKNLFFSSLIIACAMTISCSQNTDKQESSQNAVFSNMLTRTSIRQYTNKTVEQGKIDTLLRAGMSAPSAGNKQPWRFVVIQDKEIIDAIADRAQKKPAQTAPLLIAICADSNDTFPEDGFDYWVEDCSAATENMLLAAHAMGLGGCWLGFYPRKEGIAVLRSILNLPNYIIPLGVISVGYPNESPTPKDKWDETKVHYNRW